MVRRLACQSSKAPCQQGAGVTKEECRYRPPGPYLAVIWPFLSVRLTRAGYHMLEFKERAEFLQSPATFTDCRLERAGHSISTDQITRVMADTSIDQIQPRSTPLSLPRFSSSRLSNRGRGPLSVKHLIHKLLDMHVRRLRRLHHHPVAGVGVFLGEMIKVRLHVVS